MCVAGVADRAGRVASSGPRRFFLRVRVNATTGVFLFSFGQGREVCARIGQGAEFTSCRGREPHSSNARRSLLDGTARRFVALAVPCCVLLSFLSRCRRRGCLLFVRRGGSCVMVTRGVDGLAKLGGMGPQIASLVRHSEDVIKVHTVYCILYSGGDKK